MTAPSVLARTLAVRSSRGRGGLFLAALFGALLGLEAAKARARAATQHRDSEERHDNAACAGFFGRRSIILCGHYQGITLS